MGSPYQEAHQASLRDPESFWADAAQAVRWYQPWDRVLARTGDQYQWFPGATLNTCDNALDVHVENGRGDQPALLYDSPVTGTKARYTYRELRDRVARVAGMLARHGVTKGDRVILYLPMIPEAVVGMLACARLGAIHSVVFGGFAAHELATRIDDATPKLVLTASCGIEVQRVIPYKPIVDDALSQAAHQPEHCLVWQRDEGPEAALTPGRDLDWASEEAASEAAECVPVAATDPLYILYTSGTTGKPKGVVRDNGGHAVALKWSIRHIYNLQPGEVFFTASDVGWVVGHSYIVYATLMSGCTTVVYEGKPVRTPDPGAFWRLCEEYGASALFSAPTAFRAIRKEDPEGIHAARHDLSSLRTIFMAGERADTPTMEWTEQVTGKPVIDHWWQTETGWAIAANPTGLEAMPVKPGSPTVPMPGYDLRVLDPDGQPCPPGTLGNLVLRLPLAPSCLLGIWGNEERFRQSYLSAYPGYYLTGDSGMVDEDGYAWVMGRMDGIINVAGHRLSTGEMEEVVAGHPEVAECAVIGVHDELKGEVPVGFVVRKGGSEGEDATLAAEVVQRVRDEIGAVASFKTAAVVARLPKTRSGKILRGTMKKMADGETWSTPSTIEDPDVLAEIEASIHALGFPPSAG